MIDMKKSKDRKIIFLRLFFLVVEALLVVAGVVNGGYTEVLNKAIRICYECIGIG